jgi:hypothetical protein
MIIGVWLLVVGCVALCVFTSAHLVLAMVASHVTIPPWLFVPALWLCYLVPASIVIAALFIVWKGKLPGL